MNEKSEQQPSNEPEAPPENIREIIEADFETQVLKSTQPVVLDFFAPDADSEACKLLAPRFNAVAAKFSGKVFFLKVPKAKSATLAEKLGVTEVPTLLFFKAGKELGDRLKGQAIQRTALKAAVEALLK